MTRYIQRHIQNSVEYLCKSFFVKIVISRARKIRFSGEQNSVLLKASSGERCAPRNFVLLMTLRVTNVCLTVYLAVHQMKQAIERKLFSDSIITLESILTCSWNDCNQLRFFRNLRLIKTKRSIFRSRDTLLRSC